MEVTKNTVGATLLKLDQDDSFGIIAFNDQIHLFSSTLELATRESICKAIEWIGMNFVPSGGTNISSALEPALVMFSETRTSTLMVYFITDGTVEDER
ncbi:von Willebrand factor [Tanacetum coccineum]